MPALNARHRVPLRQIEATRLTKTNTSDVDADALAAELRRHVRGEVRFDDGSRALYATDGSNYRQVPIGVVIPRDIDDIIATVATARRYAAPVLAHGGGTSLAGLRSRPLDP
jgi:FAD/FMN-containing dehydrogenase